MRSMLFVPGSKPDRFLKAFSAGADGVIIDLEDSVGDDFKSEARINIINFIKNIKDIELKESKLFIRINSQNSEFFNDDLFLLDQVTNLEGVILPKVEGKKDLEKLQNFKVIPIIESAKGVVNLKEIINDRAVSQLSFGSLDMRLDIKSKMGEGENFILNNIRSKIVIISRAFNKLPPINGVFPNIKDIEALKEDNLFAKEMGFSGSLCIHPTQVNILNEIYSPDEKEMEWAKEILRLAELHKNQVFKYEGEMIDIPVILRAQNILNSFRV